MQSVVDAEELREGSAVRPSTVDELIGGACRVWAPCVGWYVLNQENSDTPRLLRMGIMVMLASNVMTAHNDCCLHVKESSGEEPGVICLSP